MPFSHHSHSGQFCAHAVDTLEQVVQAAIAKRFHTLGLTEHIYRPREDFYPEEEEEGFTEVSLKETFEQYMIEAARLRDAYSSKINIMVGFETEWIRPSTEANVKDILCRYGGSIDFFMGSIHHVLQIPIDFDHDRYRQAREKAGGTDQKLFLQYFEEMGAMLRALQPPVVGHFDLIRLKSDNPDTQFEGMEDVWTQIRSNLDYISSYGGILELNSAALRKGLAEPYPCLPICKYFMAVGGRFTLSDDSHGVAQVGTNYPRLLEFIKRAGIKEVWYADRNVSSVKNGPFHTGFSCLSVEELERHPYWSTA